MYEDLLIGVGLGFIIGFFTTYLAREVWLERKIKRLESEIEDLEGVVEDSRGKVAGYAGNLAKKEKAERMEAAMLEFAMAMKQPNANVSDILKAMALKYPDIALSLAKKGGLSL